MPGYTSEEIQAVVEKLVLSTIRRPLDTLGVRRPDVSFTDVQEAAAGVFLLYPNSPFYVLYLGAQRLGDLIAAEASIIEQLLDAIEATGRNVLPVEDVSTLFNAQAALQELGSAAAARGGIFGDITKAPAYQRFSSNVQQFLSGPGQNVKQAGTLVQTPQQARAAIPGLLSQLEDAHATLIGRVGGIAGGIDDYNKVNLPQVVSTSVLSNAAALVGADAEALDALTPTDRLTLIRQTVLNTLGVRAVVTTFGSFAPPSDFYAIEGIGRPYSDGKHLSTPAFGDAGTNAFGIIQGVNDSLTVTVDDGAPFTLTFQPSLLAELDGVATDDRFIIGNGTTPVLPGAAAVPNNNLFQLEVNGTIYQALLTPSTAPAPAVRIGSGDTTTAGWYGGGGTLNGKTLILNVNGTFTYTVTFAAPANAAAMVSQINAVTNIAGGQHLVVASIFSNRLMLTTVNTGAGAVIMIGPGTADTILGLAQGTTVRGSSGARTADQVAADIQAAMPAGIVAEGYFTPLRFSGAFHINADFFGIAVFDALGGATDFVALGITDKDVVHVLDGPNAGIYPISSIGPTQLIVSGTFVDDPSRVCEVGPAHRAVRVRCNDPATQLPNETTIKTVALFDDAQACLDTLGFIAGGGSQCLKTQMKDLAADLSIKSQALSFKAVPHYTLTNIRALTKPTDPSVVTIVPIQAVGSQAFTTTTITYTVTAVVASQRAVVPTADRLFLNDGPNAFADYSINTINGSAAPKTLEVGDVIVGTGTVAGSAGAGVTVYISEPFTPAKYDVFFIDGGPNNGDDYVVGPPLTVANIFDVPLYNRALPAYASGQNPIEMSLSYGQSYLRFTSPTPTTASRIRVSGTTLFAAIDRYGTTPWFLLPSVPRGLQADDLFFGYTSDYKTPDVVCTIDSVDTALKVIGVDPELASNVTWQFSTQPPPFGRLRMGVLNDYSIIKAKLTTWLARDVNQTAFFTNFNRFINPLLANDNPTSVQVGTAKNELSRFYAYLLASEAAAFGIDTTFALDAILSLYTVQHVDAVDTLLRTFMEKGSDRANDLLLQGAFQTFFGLTIDGASYSGAFQEAVRDVARNDLPVRRVNRGDTQNSRMISQTQSPDFEYTAASVSESVQGDTTVDPPGTYGEPANYGKTS